MCRQRSEPQALIVMRTQVADELGVNVEQPPDNRQFTIARQNLKSSLSSTDLTLLAARRGKVTQTAALPAPINISLSGLADLLHGCSSDSPLTRTPASPNKSLPPLPSRPTIRPKMGLEDFARTLELSPPLVVKLTSMGVAGPHLLNRLDDTVLRQEGGLTSAEVAELRDAEERWLDTLEQM